MKELNELIDTILDIREKRHLELKEGKLRQNFLNNDIPAYIWSYAELLKEFPAMKRLRAGDLKRPPSRQEILDLADYLQCDLYERNRLLVSAGFPFIEVRLKDEELKKAINISKINTRFLSLPSYLINADWTIYGWNDAILKLLDVDEREFGQITDDKRNLLWLLFDEKLPVYKLIDHTKGNWEYTVRRNILGFKMINYSHRYEKWFSDLIKHCYELPRFRDTWRSTQIDSWPRIIEEDSNLGGYTTFLRTRNDKVVKVMSLNTSFGNWIYPQTISYSPANVEGEFVFRELGINLPFSQWT